MQRMSFGMAFNGCKKICDAAKDLCLKQMPLVNTMQHKAGISRATLGNWTCGDARVPLLHRNKNSFTDSFFSLLFSMPSNLHSKYLWTSNNARIYARHSDLKDTSHHR